jgi:iron-sulfur cluster repair protein YtfE (RIC family)
MEKRDPIKRHKSIQPLSRAHHHGLLLCWKIRQGFQKKVATERIKSYADWFWKDHLIGHFKEEETYLFPILGKEHEWVKKALADHRRIKRLFKDKNDPVKSLNKIEEELESHIRFEERVLFNEIQAAANEEQLRELNEHLNQDTYFEKWEDKFWE